MHDSVFARIWKLTFKSLSSMLKWSKFLVSENTFIWKGLAVQVLGKLLEIIYFSTFTVW